MLEMPGMNAEGDKMKYQIKLWVVMGPMSEKDTIEIEAATKKEAEAIAQENLDCMMGNAIDAGWKCEPVE